MVEVFKRKPVPYEVLRFNDDHDLVVCEEFLNGNYDNTLNYPNAATPDGNRAVEHGDYILKDERGRFWVYNSSVFNQMFEKFDV